jgi:hypothetical protein
LSAATSVVVVSGVRSAPASVVTVSGARSSGCITPPGLGIVVASNRGQGQRRNEHRCQ